MIEYRWDLINWLIQNFESKRYLEIGYDKGVNFNNVNCIEKISVDPAQGQYIHATPTYKMTSDDFFQNVADDLELFDVIFIDGLHHSDQVDIDIINSLKHLTPSGFIVLHDCNPLKKIHQTIPRESSIWNGDVWKSLVRFDKNTDNKYGFVTLNTDQGLGVISTRLERTKSIHDIPDVLTYEWFDANRKESIRLVEPDFFTI